MPSRSGIGYENFACDKICRMYARVSTGAAGELSCLVFVEKAVGYGDSGIGGGEVCVLAVVS